MKLTKAYLAIILILISSLFEVHLSSKYSKSKLRLLKSKRTTRSRTREGPLKKISRTLRMDMSTGTPKRYREIRKDDDDTGIFDGKVSKALSKESQSRIGKYDPKYGVPYPTPNGWIPNLYPKCLVNNELATKYKYDDEKNQKELKKCALNHVFRSIDFNPHFQKKCMKEFKRNYTNIKGYGYMLSALMKYAKNGIDSSLERHFNICGNDFVDEIKAKAKTYNSNLKIAISLFSDLDDLFTYPPRPKPGYVYVKRKFKKLRR